MVPVGPSGHIFRRCLSCFMDKLLQLWLCRVFRVAICNFWKICWLLTQRYRASFLPPSIILCIRECMHIPRGDVYLIMHASTSYTYLETTHCTFLGTWHLHLSGGPTIWSTKFMYRTSVLTKELHFKMPSNLPHHSATWKDLYLDSSTACTLRTSSFSDTPSSTLTSINQLFDSSPHRLIWLCRRPW